MILTKYLATNHSRLVVKLISRNDKGEVVKERFVTFDGGKAPNAIVENFKHASFLTKDDDVKKLIEETRLFKSGRIIKDEDSKKETPIVTEELEIIDEYETVQEASMYLRDKFEELKARDVNTKDRVIAVAKSKGLKFKHIN